ncbi:MAG TPA: MarR family transcriptional regulator [Candidatus Limnocylindrales bacterium]|nr:MarR family transcriptional regulator [Candidatus Limnocylindrales bacterium]
MRSIDAAAPAAGTDTAATNEALERIVSGVHDMIAGFRCAGTGRLVKAGVSMSHMHVMWLLQHHGDLSMSHLAELLDVSFSNATGIVDRMEERGLVERVRHPDDRRVVLVRIASRGIEALEETEAIKQDRLQAILSHLDTSQVDRVAAALDDIRSAVVAEFGPDYLSGHDHSHQRAQEGITL